MDLKEQIRVALGLDKNVKLAWQSKGEDGTIYVSTAEELAAGVDVSVLTEDGTTILLPIGSYTTEDGVTFRVEEEGIVAEVMETETEEVVEEELAEEADVADWSGMEKRIENLEIAVSKLKESKVGGDTESEEMADEETTIEVVEEVIANVEEAVQEIAAAIDDATPAEVTPELAVQAAEIAIEVLQEKAEEVVEEATETTLKRKAKLSKLQKENIKLKAELNNKPASAPLNSNKFSSEATKVSLSKREISKMTKREQYLYNLYNN